MGVHPKYTCKYILSYIYFFRRWTGSNTNPENNDGQGLRGTDRSNIALVTAQQYPEGTPLTAEEAAKKNGQFGNNYPAHLNVAKFLGLPKQDRLNLAIVAPGKFCLLSKKT